MCKALHFNCKTFSGFKKRAACSRGDWTVHLRPVWLSTHTTVCVGWTEESVLVYSWLDEGKDWVVFEHLWTASLLFISVLMAWCSPALTLADWMSDCVDSRRAWCLFIAKTDQYHQLISHPDEQKCTSWVAYIYCMWIVSISCMNLTTLKALHQVENLNWWFGYTLVVL